MSLLPISEVSSRLSKHLNRKAELGCYFIDQEGGKGMERLLRALDMKPNEVDRAQTVLAQHYQDYLELKQRFDRPPTKRQA